MRLIKVYSNKDSFRTVRFNYTGPTFILAKQKDPEGSEKGKTYNGVGKSLLVHIIHFCLGASTKTYETFCSNLPGWEFILDFEIGDKQYTARRTTAEPGKVFLNNEGLSLNKFNRLMGILCFDIPSDIKYLSFRSLLPFFIRFSRDSYVTYDKPGKTGSEYQARLYNAFLLGLNVTLAQQKSVLRKEKERIKEFERNFGKDPLLRDFFTGDKDVDLTIIDLKERIQRLDDRLRSFKVAEDYYDVQLEANRVEKELFAINNDIIVLQNNVENISRNLELPADIARESMEEVYNELGIYFAEHTTKTLNELAEFYEKLITNRRKRLLEQRRKLELGLKERKNESHILQRELDRLMRYLGEHQALDLFVSLSNMRSELQVQMDKLQNYLSLQEEYKIQVRQMEIDMLELDEVTDKYLKDIKEDTAILKDYFRKLAKAFYPNSVAGLTIDNHEGDNQLRYRVEARIESDASDGINNVKIFCYDVMLLLHGKNHNIDFIFHDSRLFDGIDERQKAELFRIVYQEFSGGTKQYIATVNQNQLEEIERHLSAEEFQTIMIQNVVLTLTDESDSEKLLGIKVDL